MAKTNEYTKEAILKDRFFSNYQHDFLRAILNKETYTLDEAKKIVKNFFEGKEK